MEIYRGSIFSTRLICSTIIIVLLSVIPSFAGVSISDPLWDWKYDAIERLSLALGENTVSNTRPFSRVEMATTVLRLSARADELGSGSDYLQLILSRLREELNEEIEDINEGNVKGLKIKPLRWVRAKAVHADSPVQLENEYGFKAGNLSIRGEASTSGTWGFLGYDIRPEYNLDRDGTNEDKLDLHSGYIVVWLKNVEVEVGKDSMWWGPGRHGAWLLTNNSPAFDLIKISNAATATPPWPLEFMGDTRFTVFAGRIGEQDISYRDNGIQVQERREPLFGGFRINFTPSRYVELGAAQTVQFIDRGGRGYSFEYLRRTFLPSWGDNEEEQISGPVANRLTSTDVTIKLDGNNGLLKFMGLKGMKLYWEQGGETMGDSFIWDSSGIPQITNVSNLYGLYLDNGRIDLMAEYAFNYDAKSTWYNHYQFTEGYKNNGFYIGHNHSQDLFIRMRYPFSKSLETSLYYEKGQQNWKLPWEEKMGLSFEEFLERIGKVNLTYEYRYGDNPKQLWIFEVLHRF